ncbi:hypothetical protein FRB97_008423 [Tulasnella sp. 331]|nr:hypothetical protein FRB97_008423 [Tulasnella sp. 331]
MSRSHPTDLQFPPILLLPRSSSTQGTYDESGGQVLKSVPLPPSQPTYSTAALPPCLQPPSSKTFHPKVPPLAYYAITRHVKHLETLQRNAFLKHGVSAHLTPLPYPQQDASSTSSDLLQLLIPHMHRQSRAVRLQLVDPRLWITIIRSYWPETLPTSLFTYPLPLSDGYLPYLQYIEPTVYFTLFLVLDLKGVKELNDETIVRLKCLHQLAVLDCSETGVGTAGVRKLADALSVTQKSTEGDDDDDDDERPSGPWRLRVLSLRGCKAVDDKVVLSLRYFPLLSVVDLRYTKCQARPTIHGWSDLMREPHLHVDLYHPAPASEWMQALTELSKQDDENDGGLFESKQPAFNIHVDRLYHPKPPVKRLEYSQQSKEKRAHPEQGGWYALAPDGRLASGSMDVLEREEKGVLYHAKPRGMQENTGVGLFGDYWTQKRRLSLPLLSDPARASHLRSFEARLRSITQSHLASAATMTTTIDDDDPDAAFWSAHATREALLDELRDQAYHIQQATLQKRASEAIRRRERALIEQSRDPSAISEQDRLNRQLILIRKPPSYATLRETTERWVATRTRLAVIKEAAAGAKSTITGKRGTGSTGDESQTGLVVDKKRRTGDRAMWGEMVAQSEPHTSSNNDVAMGSSHHQREAGVGGGSVVSRKGKNPWAKTPSIDVKKIVRS